MFFSVFCTNSLFTAVYLQRFIYSASMKKNIAFLFCFASLAFCYAQTGGETKSFYNNRPAFHFTPPKNWINDPNGLVYLNKEYHLFYQYNPFGNKWGHMSWAHAVSKDLQTWKSLPLALKEYKTSDTTEAWIFSGCVVVDSLNSSGFFKKGKKNGMVAVFTSAVHSATRDVAQNQSLAYSTDYGRNWKYYAKNPVLDNNSTNFRDPNVFWYPNTKKWIMAVNKPLEYTVQFYESVNLKNWKLLSEFGKQGDTSRVWECPSLFEVPIEGMKKTKWVLLISSGHRQKNYLGMQYFVGDFDGKTFVPQKQPEIFYLDEGKDFYAAIPFGNLPNTEKKPIILGWLNDWEYAGDIPTGSVFRGAFSVPRTLSLFNEGGIYKITQQPKIDYGLTTKSSTTWAENRVIDSSTEINTTFTKNLLAESYHLQLKIENINAEGFNLEILKSGDEKTLISYNFSTKKLSLDRTKSGNVDFNARFKSIETMEVPLEDNKLTLDIHVDKWIVEIFAGGGKKALTDIVFPTKHDSKIDLVPFKGKIKVNSLRIYP